MAVRLVPLGKEEPRTMEIVRVFLSIMREEDRAEVIAAGRDPETQVPRDILLSDETYAAYEGEVLLGITGVRSVSLLRSAATPWLLGTRHIVRHRRALLEGSLRLLARWRRRYSVLFNEVISTHAGALNWARHVGFSLGEPTEKAGGHWWVPIVMEGEREG